MSADRNPLSNPFCRTPLSDPFVATLCRLLLAARRSRLKPCGQRQSPGRRQPATPDADRPRINDRSGGAGEGPVSELPAIEGAPALTRRATPKNPERVPHISPGQGPPERSAGGSPPWVTAPTKIFPSPIRWERGRGEGMATPSLPWPNAGPIPDGTPREIGPKPGWGTFPNTLRGLPKRLCRRRDSFISVCSRPVLHDCC